MRLSVRAGEKPSVPPDFQGLAPAHRTYFADFPYHTLFYRLEASDLGDLMRLSVRAGEKPSVPPDFQGLAPAHRTAKRAGGSARLRTASPAKPLPRCARYVNKNRELLPGQGPTSPGSLTLPSQSPRPGAGILTGFPFSYAAPACDRARFRTPLGDALGSTHPCPTAVRTEPFSSSAFKVLI